MAVDVQAELQRRRLSDGALIPWHLNDDGTDPVALSTSQVADLKNVSLPSAQVADLKIVSLPAAQVADLKAVSLPAAQIADLKTVTITNMIETGLAKDATLTSILAQLDDASADTVLSVLKTLLTELQQKVEPVDLAGLARDATVAKDASLTAINAALGVLQTELGQKVEPADLNVLGREATLQAILTELYSKLESQDLAAIAKDATLNDLLIELREKVEPVHLLTVAQESTLNRVITELEQKVESADLVNLASHQDIADLWNSIGLRTDTADSLGVIGLLKALKAKDFATDARLEAVRALLDGVPLRDITDRAARLLGRVTVDNFPSSTEIANDIGNPVPVTATNITATELSQGRFFIYGTGKMSLTASGFVRATISNPSSSTRTLKIHRVAVFSSAGPAYAELRTNPTTGLPASAPRPYLNAIAGGGLSPLAEVRADTNITVPLAGGVDTGVIIGIPAAIRTELNLPPLILAPGVTLGVNIPFAGAADMTMSVYTTEA